MTVELDEPDQAGAGPARAQRPSRGQIGWSLFLILIGLVVPAVAIALVYRSCRESTARGRLEITAADGTWRTSLMWCGLVAPDVRSEVTLAHGDGATDRVRIFYDHQHEPRVEVARGGQFAVLDASTCTRLKLEPARHGPDLGDLDLSSGSLDAECRTAAGERVVIDAWWKHCAAPSSP